MKMESTYIRPGIINLKKTSFKILAKAVFTNTEIDKIVKEKFVSLLVEEDLYTSRESGFSLEKIDGLLQAVYHYTPMGGSSFTEVSTLISTKKAVIDPQKNDEHCFKWAILVKHVGVHKERVRR